MTLSLHPSTTPWDRTLPKPPALLPIGTREQNHDQGSLHHQIGGNQLFDKNERFLQENGRRDTIQHDPIPHVSYPAEVHANTRGVDTESRQVGIESSRQRTTSIMSTGDTSRSSSPASTGLAEGSGICLCQREPKIPRPRNAFILYRQHHHAAVVAQHPGLPNPEISKIIGEHWRHLPDQAKEEWRLLAEDEKVRHSQQYPDYRYKPRRSGRSGGISSSISGPSPATSETPTACQKCGGKSMNPPQPLNAVTASGVSAVSPMTTGMPHAQHLLSSPHSAHTRQYPDAYGRPVAVSFDPRLQYPPGLQRPVQMAEGPESKKRRFNGDPVYSMARPMYVEQGYQRSPHERKASDAMVSGQFHRSNMGPPTRTGHPVQMQANRLSHPQQHRRDLSLTLPPLKTPLSQQVSASFTSGPHSQRSGVEAMIMSIPVLNKTKILSQIAPPLAVPGPASPPREVRGAIVAVEGMDSTSVYNMTNTLAEQLEKEGKFAVRIFGGPDPYTILASSSRASNGEGEYLSVSGFLDLISQWHKISKEMQDYITKRPRSGEETPDDVVMQDATHSAHPPSEAHRNQPTRVEQPRTPVSAVSPKTITQTADMSLKSPLELIAKKKQAKDESVSQTTQRKSRIPASAIAQANAQAETDIEAQSSSSLSTPRPGTSQAHQQQSLQDQMGNSALTKSAATSNSQQIPVALVPHYQLTTVDSSSIAMPITDAYSPHSHWQWLATLWRGCLGPDVTVVIQAGELSEDASITSDPSATVGASRTMSQSLASVPPSQQQQQQQQPVFGPLAPTTHRLSQAQHPHHPSQPTSTTHKQPQQTQQQQQQQQQQQDVEVRLLDCRAVVVRAPPRSVRTSTSGGGSGSEREGSEWWEKAKRRVGFEVEEFLRR